MCGNGIRCVGKFVYDKGLTDKTVFTVETLAGIKTLNLTLKNGKVSLVKVDMGEPILESGLIPAINTFNAVSKDGFKYSKVNLKFLDVKTYFTCVSMCNPHAICFIKDISNLDISLGTLIENNNHFPNRTNVEFIEVINSNEIKMRVWERGVGETLACGTGACASAVASILNGYTNRCVQVDLLGGNLYIEWGLDNHVYLTGPAKIVFDGEIDINSL